MNTIYKAKKRRTHSFYEFFAGGGMARAGLGEAWTCLFANDFDHKKSRSYEDNWGTGVLKTADVRMLVPADIPDRADLAWASFPCQDLSLAGGGAGLKGDRSGTFWPFWELMLALVGEDRAPSLIVLENVCGALTSHDGKDFAAIGSTFLKAGYRFGAVVIDAALFVPHSRPRLFMVGVRGDVYVPPSLMGAGVSAQWHPRALRTAFDKLPSSVQTNWIWWRLPPPPLNDVRFADIIEDAPTGVIWHSPAETARLLNMMSAVNRAKVEQAKQMGRRMVGTIYKRTRLDENGFKAQRAEIRFDDIAGCLRTPAGGSSRQLIVVVNGGKVKSRLISSRETARLMGLSDDYILPKKYNEAYHLTGDGVVVPVVRHLAEHLFEQLLTANRQARVVAA
jgi:DNA (cytosine-5)-methyltransferase 1